MKIRGFLEISNKNSSPSIIQFIYLTTGVHLARSHEFVGRDFVLGGDEFGDRFRVLQKHLHADERLASLLREHVPRLGSGQQVRHRALGQTQHGLPKQSLADAVLAE